MEQTYDLTQGNIKRQLIYLSIPLLIGSIFQQFYNTIDSIIVGTYVGHDAFAAIGISGTVMNLFIFIIIGCCTGVSIITAQLYGEKNYDKMRNEIFLSSILGIVVTIIILIVIHRIILLTIIFSNYYPIAINKGISIIKVHYFFIYAYYIKYYPNSSRINRICNSVYECNIRRTYNNFSL